MTLSARTGIASLRATNSASQMSAVSTTRVGVRRCMSRGASLRTIMTRSIEATSRVPPGTVGRRTR